MRMDFRKALSACCKHWKRSFHSCCSKKILLLLLWQALFSFSNMLILSCAAYLNFTSPVFISASQFFSGIFAPLIGWFADVKIGRYETIKFGSFISFAASIFFYFAIFTGSVSTLSIILYSVSIALVSLGNASFSAAILPFFTDQVIGATADELSTLIYWYVWADNFGFGLSFTIGSLAIVPYIYVVGVAPSKKWKNKLHFPSLLELTLNKVLY